MYSNWGLSLDFWMFRFKYLHTQVEPRPFEICLPKEWLRRPSPQCWDVRQTVSINQSDALGPRILHIRGLSCIRPSLCPWCLFWIESCASSLHRSRIMRGWWMQERPLIWKNPRARASDWLITRPFVEHPALGEKSLRSHPSVNIFRKSWVHLVYAILKRNSQKSRDKTSTYYTWKRDRFGLSTWWTVKDWYAHILHRFKLGEKPCATVANWTTLTYRHRAL